MRKLSIREKMTIIEKSIYYATRPNSSGCLSCSIQSHKDIGNIISALNEIGLSAKEVDWFTHSEHPNGIHLQDGSGAHKNLPKGTRLENETLGCVDPKQFLFCIGYLLGRKEE